jgi:Na+-transporting NADH:ubiquinone oxidoreductase subunit B
MGKEIFGGTGRNLVHPVLLAWAFLFVAYPETYSGDSIWVAVDDVRPAWIHIVGEEGSPALAGLDWGTAFLGLTPGTFGAPSTLACLLGLGWLLLAKLVSWRVVVGFVAGSALAAALFAAGDPGNNPLFGMPVHWQFVLGGWAFGLAFIVTDPVTGAHTNPGRWVYGFIAGAFVIFVRVLNPTQIDGVAIALLFMNLFAPLVDYWFVSANIRRRRARNAAQ